MKISVILPTYCRPKDLERCLDALHQQTRLPNEIIVVVRETDESTAKFLKRYALKESLIKVFTVRESGVIAALNIGLKNASGDILAITDDDAAPHENWLERIELQYLGDNSLGAVGGPDFIYLGEKLQDASMHPGASSIVGRLQWFGRMIGNHHIGSGQARLVDFLKGVNSSYRKDAIKDLLFDARLKGTGAQVYNELAMCLEIKSRGWNILYDPSIMVDHYPAQRFDEDQRNQFNPVAEFNMSFNETFVLLTHLPSARRLVYLVWAFLMGSRSSPGILQYIRFSLLRSYNKSEFVGLSRLVSSLKGRWAGLAFWYLDQRKI